MYSLFKNELLTYKNSSIIIAAVHFVILFHAYSTNHWPDFFAVGGVIVLYAVAAYMFGVKQIKTYLGKGLWVYLLNMPLSRLKIFAAITSAAVAGMFVVCVIPWLLALLAASWLPYVHVEKITYIRPVYFFLYMLLGYFAALFSILSAHRGVQWFASVLLIPLCAIGISQSSANVLWLLLAALVLYIYIAYQAFKPDTAAPYRGPTRIIVVTLAIQIGLFSAAVILGNGLTEMFRDRNPVYPEESYEYFAANSNKSGGLIKLALSYLPEEQRHQWRDKLDQRTLFNYRGGRAKMKNLEPREGAVPFESQIKFRIRDNNTHWVYSRDERLFYGVNQDTGEQIGWLGPDAMYEGDLRTISDADRFGKSLTMKNKNGRFIVTRNKVYIVGAEEGVIELRYTLRDDEIMQYLAAGKNGVQLFSSKRLYLFDQNFIRSSDTLTPVYMQNFSVWNSQSVRKAHIMVKEDGVFAAYLFKEGSGSKGAEVVLQFHPRNGEMQELLRQPLPQIQRNEFVNKLRAGAFVSPAYTVSMALAFCFSDLKKRSCSFDRDIANLAFVMSSDILMIVMLVASAGIIYLRAQNSSLSRGDRVVWVCMGFVGGLAAVACAFFMVKKLPPNPSLAKGLTV